ncbi:hypothetical protein N0V88_005250 [Collariella sp. IMI 366227]|nr:hypothetical protein N0V88_005250 [Collariella sp. IMI 366227]
MGSSDDSGRSATDVITYIGVPLAVLGVLPILYNTFMTLNALSRIKRMLRHSKLTALTRSDVVNRVIEVELPRYAVRPWDRFSDRAEYWTLSRHPSNIPGGSWTTFNWRTNVIGLNTQRVEYADQLRQPQVEVAFDELVCYLLDLGAVPDPHGWRLLRSTGLWTPVGCALMMSPDGKEKALSIAPLDGSDGHLSLAVTWAGPWTTRDSSQLPPYWVRLPPPSPSSSTEEDQTPDAGPSSDSQSVSAAEADADSKSTEPIKPSSATTKPSLDSARHHGTTASLHPITCQISTDGIVTALSDILPLEQSTLDLDTLHIEHLRTRSSFPSTPTFSTGSWFASAATAYGTSSQTILWNYRIPDPILSFARKETVPCGVLVLLDVVEEAKTPEWASTGRDRGIRGGIAQRAVAVQERLRRENEERLGDMRERLRMESQRRDTRMMEALQSPKWDAKLAAEHNLAWLQKNGHVPAELGMKEVVGTLLHRMVLDGQFAATLCRMLDLWKAWAENAGMRKSDYAALAEDQTTFAYATLLVAIIKDTSTALEGTLAMDLQECLRMWRTIRLG